MQRFDHGWREVQLQTLLDLSLRLGGVRREEELVEELLQRAVGSLDARRGLVGTQYPDGTPAVVQAVGTTPTLETAFGVLPERGVERLQSGEVVHVTRQGDGPLREILAAPIRWRDQMLGLIVIGDKEGREGPVPFPEGDDRFLLSLASMGGAAVATARSFAAIERDRQRLEEENRALRDRADAAGFVGESEPIRRVFELARRVGPTDVNVMIRGESGVGKERLARLLHELSERSEGPFVPLNCAALPESLLEAELFGIEEGVATGVSRRLGKLELADGGTVLLDEVGDLSLPLQAKLLRVVQERELERVGGRERIPLDFRLITATNQPLESLVESGRFREDLYYRLRVVVAELPPLRDRRSDIPLLVRHFLQIYGERFGRPDVHVSRGALGRLMRYDYPGNIRELENIVQAAVALAPGDEITEHDLNLAAPPAEDESAGGLPTLADMERRHIRRVLELVDGNRGRAAELLGINRTTLYRKLRRSAS